MAYTIGASHGPFTGNGSFAVSKPTGIRTVVTGIPFYTGHDGSIPRRYFRLGRFTMGNADGFQFSHGLEYVQQLLYPMPPVWEILAYDVKDGASCTFYELVDVPDLTLKQPWDRALVPWFGGAESIVTGGAAGTSWTYTVPVGRRLWVSTARVCVTVYNAPTAVGYRNAYIGVASVGNYVSVFSIGGAVGSRLDDQISGAQLILSPGQVIAGTHSNNDTGGNIYITSSAAGFLFDA